MILCHIRRKKKMKRIFTCATLLMLLILVLTACSFNLDKNPQELTFYPKDDGTYAVAMGNAKLLSEITIPAKYKGKAVTEIAENGFEKCAAKRIVIPDSVAKIEKSAYYQNEEDDLEHLKELLKKIQDMDKSCVGEIKKIKINWLIQDLENYIKKLTPTDQ